MSEFGQAKVVAAARRVQNSTIRVYLDEDPEMSEFGQAKVVAAAHRVQNSAKGVQGYLTYKKTHPSGKLP